MSVKIYHNDQLDEILNRLQYACGGFCALCVIGSGKTYCLCGSIPGMGSGIIYKGKGEVGRSKRCSCFSECGHTVTLPLSFCPHDHAYLA